MIFYNVRMLQILKQIDFIFDLGQLLLSHDTVCFLWELDAFDS